VVALLRNSIESVASVRTPGRGGLAPAQNLRVVNAASLSATSVAPGSIITVFGTSITSGVAYAANTQNPPVNSGGATVSIGGGAAALFLRLAYADQRGGGSQDAVRHAGTDGYLSPLVLRLEV
jgi:hypothetical protein